MLSYAADNFGGITIALATTAYVVFTYHLLESAEAQRRRSAEPYLTIGWYLANQATEKHIPLFSKLAQDFCGLFERMAVSLKLEELPPSDQRFVILEISNAREVPLTWLQLSVTASATIPNQSSVTMRDQISLENLNLGRGGRLPITVLDVGSIPTTASVSTVIDTLVYGPAEAEVLLEEFSGTRSFNTTGVLAMGGARPEAVRPAGPAGG